MDLESALRIGPGKALDLRREVGAASTLQRTVVAFANGAGGTVLIGIDPASREVRGVADPLALSERVSALITDGVRPIPAFDAEILPWREVQLLAVRVHPGPQRPYQLRRAGLEEGVFVRVGAEERQADPALIEELRRTASGQVFDEQPAPHAGGEAIDRDAVRECLRRARVEPPADGVEALLLEWRVLLPASGAGGRAIPSLGGLILFGRDRDRHFPDAWIQAGRFRGADRATIMDSAEIRMPLPLAVEEALAFARRNTAQPVRIGDVRHVEEPVVPPVALREALVNAVVHADYSQRGAPIRLAVHDDRVEITSPGLLPPGLTLADLERGVSRVRNRVLGRVFHALGLIEQWGSGMGRMRRAMRDAGLPAPAFTEIGLSFRVELPTERVAEPVADGRDEIILDLLAERGPLSTSEVAAVVGISDRATRTRLRHLVERGAATEIGSGPNDPQRKYAVLQRRERRPRGPLTP